MRILLTWDLVTRDSVTVPNKHSSGLYYKHMTIVNDDSSIVIKWSFKLIDAARGIIYDCHMFIVKATDYYSQYIFLEN
jgi:hypothetical protein